MNLVEYLARATAYLEERDVASPRLNAELLLCHLLDIGRLDIYTGFERALTPEEAERYKNLVKRRGTGCPLQYLTGECGFRGLTLEVREGVFIPRPETELLVEKALGVLPGGEADVLDLGTGCGAIAVCIATEHPGARVMATDLDPEALALCERNAQRAGVAGRIETMPGDLFEPLAGSGRTFDALVSNPPYVPSSCAGSLSREVREHEPPAALFAGTDGLDVIRVIVAGAPPLLREGGWMLLEIDESQGDAVLELLAGGGWADVEVFDDLNGRPRVVRAKKP
ncbi:MAG: peptide chain release factor N(5)-glutamine methyltransferase [Actinobacteria bacterium]|nr:peptide chain release factor N(5)-glutamine methyltransferase [Actinomycetota bacterium]MBU1944959.1 peptide chain release factor N(5)-glutamine methyltransferase [Actinomycetota bacterium]MBU2688441.1 peptide chain release factor N(5)-glutamine methyltransferase [Actinomycetota bacterium]